MEKQMNVSKSGSILIVIVMGLGLLALAGLVIQTILMLPFLFVSPAGLVIFGMAVGIVGTFFVMKSPQRAQAVAKGWTSVRQAISVGMSWYIKTMTEHVKNAGKKEATNAPATSPALHIASDRPSADSAAA